MDVGVRNVCGPMKCSCSRLDWLHPDPSLTQSMHVLWIIGFVLPILKTWRLFFCLTHFLSVCSCLVQYETFINCVPSTLVVFVFFIESSGVVTLSWFKAPSGFHWLDLIPLGVFRRVSYLRLWPTKPKVFVRTNSLLLTFTSQVRQEASGIQMSCFGWRWNISFIKMHFAIWQ